MDLEPSTLEANSLLNFYDNINVKTGEINTKNKKGQPITPFKKAFYNGLEFRIYYTGTITCSGSLHKYYNLGEHNYNDFDFKAFLSVLNDLTVKFNINIEHCIIRCLEVGVNIIPPIPTDKIIKYSFLHKTKDFEYQKNSNEGKYKQCQHSQYIIKLYDKALHYRSQKFKIENEILRFEIKYTKMERLNSLGIYNLMDLVKAGFKKFENELITEWNNILLFDTSVKIEGKRLIDYNNPIYWNKLANHKSKSNFYKQKNKLRELTFNSSDRVHNSIQEIIRTKIDFLCTKCMF